MQSVANALRILEEVGRQGPIGVTGLARELDLPKSSVQRALRTLHTAGWIRPAGGELTRWLLTTKALHVGWRGTGELSLREAAMPVMEQLRQRTEETIHLMVPEGNHVVLIERLDTPKVVRIVIPLGGGAPIHASANGKAILAHSPRREVERLFAEGLPRYTETTIVDPGELWVELAETRTRGYATNAAEWRSDIAAVAAAILAPDGRPVGSISISTPVNRMPADVVPEYGRLVRDAVRRIADALGRVNH